MSEWQNVPKNIEDYQGFVYMIRRHIDDDDKYYIGKKNFWKVVKYPPLKGRKNKRHKKVETKWRDYWGSSDALKKDVKKYGKKNFRREMLYLCKDKWEMSYKELQEQMRRNVLFDENSYNNIIQVRLKGRKQK